MSVADHRDASGGSVASFGRDARAGLFVGVLGPTVVRLNGEHLALPMMRRALLAFLALGDRRGTSIDSLVDGLWGETPPEHVRNTLQVHVSGLRRVLGHDSIRTTPLGYRLSDSASCDADDLNAGIAVSLRERRNPTTVAATLAPVLELWRGQPLADVTAPFAEAERGRLVEAYLTAFELHTDAQLAIGNHEQVIGPLERVVSDQPLRELPWAQLITALHRSDRQADALAIYRRVRRLLRDELGADPGEAIQQAHLDVLGARQQATPLPDAGLPPTPRTALVGRDRDVATLRDWVADPNQRIVTVLGPGGVGKTRLALEVAHQEAETGRLHGGRVRWVPLTTVTTAEDLPGRVGRTLGLDEGGDPGAVIAALTKQQLLLVLDNLEHLLPAAATWVGRLLDACPTVTILATSRTASRVAGERRYPLTGLPATDNGGEASPAATMLLRCADAVRPGWVSGRADLDAVNDLAARLEGIPLALELAAARAPILSPVALRDGLQRHTVRLGSHGPDIDPRHRTLEATLAWSYELLDQETRSTLGQLAAFHGVIPLEAAAAVTELTVEDFLERATALVDASLLLATAAAQPVFTMLETIVSGVRELADPGELAAAVDRHATWYADLAAKSADHLWARDQTDWFTLLEADHANLRAALDRLLRTAPERALAMATHLAPFWEAGGYLEVGLRWLLTTLDAAGGADPATRAKAMFVGSRMAEQGGDLNLAEALVRESRALYEEVGDMPGLIFALSHEGVDAGHRGADAVADRLTSRSVTLARALGDPWYVAMALNNHGYNRVFRGDVDRDAATSLEESLALRLDLGEPRGIAVTMSSIIEMELVRGDLTTAASLLDELAAVSDRLPQSEIAAVGLNLLGCSQLLGGDVDRAAATFGKSLHLAVRAGYRRMMLEAVLGLAAVAAVRAMDRRALRLCSAAVASNDRDGIRLTALEQRLVGMVQIRTHGIEAPTRSAIVDAASAAPMERIVAEALAVAADPPRDPTSR